MKTALTLATCLATTLLMSCATNEITTTYTDAKGQVVKVVNKSSKYDAGAVLTTAQAASLIAPYIIHPDK